MQPMLPECEKFTLLMKKTKIICTLNRSYKWPHVYTFFAPIQKVNVALIKF